MTVDTFNYSNYNTSGGIIIVYPLRYPLTTLYLFIIVTKYDKYKICHSVCYVVHILLILPTFSHKSYSQII